MSEYLNKTINLSEKNSFSSDTKFGFNVQVEYIIDYPYNGAVKIYHNVSEFHTHQKNTTLYIKSDTHCQSVLKGIDTIISAKIFSAKKISDVF